MKKSNCCNAPVEKAKFYANRYRCKECKKLCAVHEEAKNVKDIKVKK